MTELYAEACLYARDKHYEDNIAKYWYNKGHEDGRKLVPLKDLTDEEIIKNFIDKQTQLPPEFQKVLYDNLWNLYES